MSSIVNVYGTAEADVPADYAVVHCSATAKADTAEAASAEANAIADRLRAHVPGIDGVREFTLHRVSVSEEQRWVPETQTYVNDGWRATVSGKCEVTPQGANPVLDAVVSSGGGIDHVMWLLDQDNPAYREVRKAAVADARRAAADFADAAGKQLGELLVLADPGLLGSDGGQVRAKSADMHDGAPMMAGAPVVDPAEIRVGIRVEARFEMQ